MYVPRQNITYSDAVVKSVSPLDPFVDACLYKERERERERQGVCVRKRVRERERERERV